MKNSLTSEQYKPKFSGHETFPLRFGWLKKSYDACSDLANSEMNNNPFSSDDAIARFGVGKNMVSSIQHWSEAAGIIENLDGIKITNFGDRFFHNDGLDPYLESPSTLWLLHWKMVSNATLTTWHWAFNYFAFREFSREQLSRALNSTVEERGWGKRPSNTTIKRDVDCFVRTYCPKKINAKDTLEEALESPLVELGLIYSPKGEDIFRFNVGEKPNLTSNVIAFAIMEFWDELAGSKSDTLSVEKVVFDPSSPGRVFLIDEDSLTQRLEKISETTDGLISWSETAGLKQLIRNGAFSQEARLKLIEKDFTNSSNRKAS